MSPSAEQGLANIFAAAQQQVELLRDASERADINRAGLAVQSLDLLLAALASEATRLGAADDLGKDTRERLATFADAVAELQAATIDVHTRLHELAEDWQCSACEERVVRDAVVVGLRAGAPRVELVCRACGGRTALTAAGERLLAEAFGHLMQPGWQPRNNGFLVDGEA